MNKIKIAVQNKKKGGKFIYEMVRLSCIDTRHYRSD